MGSFFSDPTRVLICPQMRRPLGVLFRVQRQHVHIKEASERRRPNIPVVLQFDSPVFLLSLRSAPPQLICLSGGEWHRGFFVFF